MDAMTIWETFERSRSFFPYKEALVFVDKDDEQNTQTYNELARETNLIALSTKARVRASAGDRICLSIPNTPELVEAYLANSQLRITNVLLNPALPTERVEKVLQSTEAKLIKRSRDRAIFGEILESQSDLKTPETAAILYSSGTTGEQKGVELTVSNIYNNIKYTSVLTGMTPEDRLICFLPLTHCFGLNFVLGACLYTGATLVLHEKFDLQQVLDSIVRNKVTMFFAVPAIYNMMLKQKIDPFYFASVRYFFYAADTLSVDSILAWEREYGRKIYTGWGLTETSPFATSNHESIYKLGNDPNGIPSVGKPIPGVEIKVVNEKDFYGEVYVRGHNVMKGYWNQPEETSEAINKEGWFRARDIGYQDKEGYLYIVDRSDDMINVGGEKAWPAVIEKIILQHPDVIEAGVVGVPNKEMGKVPKAFVVRRDEKLTKEELLEFIKHRLMKHELTREIEFIDKLPRSPSGKILRRELRSK